MVWTCFVIAAAGIVLEALKYARWATNKQMKSHEENVGSKTKYGGIEIPERDKNSRANMWVVERSKLMGFGKRAELKTAVDLCIGFSIDFGVFSLEIYSLCFFKVKNAKIE